ncbi:hypothetical protein KH579_001816 [Salmonella enterica]|nr:hypothetical protein [Salmonella enterica]
MGKLENPGHYAGIFLRVICHSFTRFSSKQRDRVTTQKKTRGENAAGKQVVTHGKNREKRYHYSNVHRKELLWYPEQLHRANGRCRVLIMQLIR